MAKKDPSRLSHCPAQRLHLELLARASTLPGEEIARWLVAHPHLVSAVMSGAIPGEEARQRQPGEPLVWVGRHAGGLRPLRGLAFGRWEPSHVWIEAASPEASEVLTRTAAHWDPTSIRQGTDPGDPFRSRALVELYYALPPPRTTLAPPDASAALRVDVPLAQASPQEIQFELLARTRLNGYDGARVAGDLQAHRSLWRAAMLGRDDVVSVQPDGRRMHLAPFWSTLHLLPEERVEGYQGDHAWFLVPDRDAGRRLLALARQQWGCAQRRLWNHAGSHRTAGCQGEERIVSLWWDASPRADSLTPV